MELSRVEAVIEAPIEAVWEMIADFGHPQRLSASIKHCEMAGKGIGAVRTVHARGLTILERLLECDAARHVLRYEILPEGDMPAPGMKRYEATAVLHALSSGSVAISWSSEGEAEGDLQAVRTILNGIYGAGIKSLRRVAGAAPSASPQPPA